MREFKNEFSKNVEKVLKQFLLKKLVNIMVAAGGIYLYM
jgi:hypothetical protein